MKIKTASLVVALQLCSGCASIIGSTDQIVSVKTQTQDAVDMSGARCVMSNSKGRWTVTSPGTVNILRSNDNLLVTCRKNMYAAGSASVVSDTKLAMYGNIIFGGVIGAVIDHNRGAAYEYPGLLNVNMGVAEPGAENPRYGVVEKGFRKRDSKEVREAYETLDVLKSVRDRGMMTQQQFDVAKSLVLKDI